MAKMSNSMCLLMMMRFTDQMKTAVKTHRGKTTITEYDTDLLMDACRKLADLAGYDMVDKPTGE